MSFVGLAVGLGVATVAGAVISSQGAQSAANTQAGAARNAQNISQNEFQQIVGMNQPYLQSGYGALQQLNYGLGTGGTPDTGAAPGIGAGSLNQPFTADYMKQYSPGYQFQMQQGQQGVLNQAASSQGAMSGAALKDLMGFNQQYANTAYNNAFNQYQTQQNNTYNRLSGIAGMGQASANQTAQSGTALAGQSAQSAQNIGSALAAGQVGSANAWGSATGSLGMLPFLTANQQAGGFDLGSMGIGYQDPYMSGAALGTISG